MEIKTEYSIGQEVYILYKEPEENFARIFINTITEIAITKDKILYYTDNFFDEIDEEMLIPVGALGESVELYKKIRKLLQKCDKTSKN